VAEEMVSDQDTLGWPDMESALGMLDELYPDPEVARYHQTEEERDRG
jgi:hypothetical protein